MIGFSIVAEPLFCRTPPSGCLCALLKKNKRNEIVCFYSISLTFFFVQLQGSVGETEQIKNISASKMKKKKKNSLPETKFTGSYKKKSVSQEVKAIRQ